MPRHTVCVVGGGIGGLTLAGLLAADEHDVTLVERAPGAGDAAHALTPNMGQGAGGAMADALVLSRSLDAAEEVVTAQRGYESRRRDRGAWVPQGFIRMLDEAP